MEKRILIILIESRTDSSLQVQKYLTEFGCMIKTRLGIHDGISEGCSEEGLIILELIGDKKKCEKLSSSLNKLDRVSCQLVELPRKGEKT